MDTNPMNCAKCGHTVNETAVACAYCGAAISSGDSPPPPDEEAPGTAAQSEELSPSPADDFPPVLDMIDESANTPEGFELNLDAEPSSPIQPQETQAEINEPGPGAVPGAQDQSSDTDDQIDFQLSGGERIVELDTEKAAEDPEQGSGSDSISAAIRKAELNPDRSVDSDNPVGSAPHAAEAAAEVMTLPGKVSAKAAPDDSADLPETPVLELSGEEPSESEILGADIMELVADESSEAASTRQQASETWNSSDEPAVEKMAEIAPEPAAEGPDNKDGELEAILLTSADDAESATQSLPAEVEEAVKTGESEKPVELAAPTTGITAKSDDSSESAESQAKAKRIQKQTAAQASVAALKIEKAAQELAEAQKKQKADIAKAQALKKKKIELAKTQALKRKKVAALKAQALKKEKEAQALKKQKEAQAGIEKAIKGMAAGSMPPKADNADTINQSMEANDKILDLLKKYEGQAIGINYDNSADIKEAELVEANDEFISVFVKDKELNYSHPLKTILTIIEGLSLIHISEPTRRH